MGDIVLNIAYNDLTVTRRSSTAKTGHWKERQVHKEVKAKHIAKRKDAPSSVTTLHNESRPPKRQKTETKVPSPSKPPNPASRPVGHVVSSLFTSNPSVPRAESSLVASQSAQAPSNAPLGDTSTFEGLGLDPLLVQHLGSKMEIARPTGIQRSSLPFLLAPYDAAKPMRDVFIQAQTGSGKTLSYLLPIIQDLLPLSSLSYIDRSIGTLAVIIAPTRELAKQIYDVLEVLLKMRLRDTEEVPEDENAPRRTRWLVPGLLTGGATRTHEKARLRKGLPILVATPGRLLDHLQNTTSFNVGKCRWLVLDEADRLMELGFEESIQGILKGLDGRRNLDIKAAETGVGLDVISSWEWRPRRTVLCSATLQENVQKLAGSALQNPIMVKGLSNETQSLEASKPTEHTGTNEGFTPPSQLTQRYVVAPLKLRLVTLIALLRHLLKTTSNQKQKEAGTKIIVFLSCTDSVDFHWDLFGQMKMNTEQDGVTESDAAKAFVQCPLLPGASIYRLHGSLPLPTRLASLKGFSAKATTKTTAETTHSILLCTSVASRGLDLPLVRAVVQYDLPTEGGATEYVHRVGRTARAGKGGEAWSFVGPSETEWVPWIEKQMISNEGSSIPVKLNPANVASILRQGFGGSGAEHEDRATQVQLELERWVLKSAQNTEIAKKAFQSHMRAYATHPSDEKHIFHIKNLHTGHLAKCFALREAPSHMHSKSSKSGKQNKAKGNRSARGGDASDSDSDDRGAAEKRMQTVVRAQGRLLKKGGKLVNTDISEFQIADVSGLA